MSRKNMQSFEMWCMENSREDLLELWDYELNEKLPSEVSCFYKKKMYFKCPQGIHDSEARFLKTLTDKVTRQIKCRKCNSLGQYIIDTHDGDFLSKIWSSKNVKSPFSYARMGSQKLWFKCINAKHEDFERLIANAVRSDFSCPICSLENNLSRQKMDLSNQKFGDLTVIKYDEDKSKEKGKNYWVCKCKCGEIDSICIGALREGQKTCGNRSYHQSGEYNPNWNGGNSITNKELRKDSDYSKWRQKILELDNYKCQCCGGIQELEVHHIRSFKDNEALRYDISNGIVLCKPHHSTTRIGSYHNIYGIRDFTLLELEKYINNERKQLGNMIPFDINEHLRNRNVSKLDQWIEFINADPEDPDFEELLDKEEING